MLLQHRISQVVVGLVLVCSAAVLMLAFAQPEHKVTSQLAQTPVAKMIGTWKGTSWAFRPDGQRHEGPVVERVRWHLAGAAILVEGYGHYKDEASGEFITVHEATGLIELEKDGTTIAFYARRAGEPFVKRTLEVDGDTLRWFIDGQPGMKIRFTLTLTDTTWTEIGEMSRDDGQTWTQFLGMELTKTAAK